jgi:pescadillo protein
LSKIIAAEEENRKIKSLFKNLVFFISREIQSEIFGLAIMSAGGLYGDETDNSPFESNDARITHYVIDRPAEFITFEENKEYVQPQWIFDCINSKTLLPVSEYAPGKKLPPHLSPFYEYDEEGIAKLKLKAANRDLDELNEDEEKTKPDEANELKEMMISKNKKKLLAKIREEKQKKKRKLKTDEKK